MDERLREQKNCVSGVYCCGSLSVRRRNVYGSWLEKVSHRRERLDRLHNGRRVKLRPLNPGGLGTMKQFRQRAEVSINFKASCAQRGPVC